MNDEMTTTSAVQEFKTVLIEGINGIVRASEIYVAAIDKDAEATDIFKQECSEFVPNTAWASFEAVGRKWMHPKLLMGGMTDRKKASFIKQLPYSTQEKIFNHQHFDLLVLNGETLNINVLEATREQVEQLCNGNTMRNLAEQKAWLESRASQKDTEKPHLMPYTIMNGKVSFRKGTTLTRTEIKRLLQEM